MLETILNGNEISKSVIICDHDDARGNGLLYAFIHSHHKRGNILHIVLFEHNPSDFKALLNLQDSSNIYLYDKYSDPAAWNDENTLSIEDRWFEIRDQVKSRCMGGASHNHVIVIDSFSPILRVTAPNATFRYTHNLFLLPSLQQTIILHHSHLHSDVINKSLMHICDTVLTLKRFSNRYGPVNKKSLQGLVCETVHRKSSGKVLTSKEELFIQSNLNVQVKVCSLDTIVVTMQNTTLDGGNEPDVTSEAGLTFNLNLSRSEKEARSKLVMPYMKEDKVEIHRGRGKIFYEADDRDDFDEEDPDEDLEF